MIDESAEEAEWFGTCGTIFLFTSMIADHQNRVVSRRRPDHRSEPVRPFLRRGPAQTLAAGLSDLTDAFPTGAEQDAGGPRNDNGGLCSPAAETSGVAGTAARHHDPDGRQCVSRGQHHQMPTTWRNWAAETSSRSSRSACWAARGPPWTRSTRRCPNRKRQLWPLRDVRRANPQVPPPSHPLRGPVRAVCVGRRERALRKTVAAPSLAAVVCRTE